MSRLRSMAGLGVAVAMAASTACTSNAAADAPVKPGDQYIVGIDVSASRPKEAVNESRRLLKDLIASKLKNGDQLIVLEMYGGAESATHQWMDTVPHLRQAGKASPIDARKLSDFQARADQVATLFIDAATKARIQSTDILGTLTRAADYVKSSGGRHSTVILLSDMENSTSELEMANRIPDITWIGARKAQNRLPDLSEVCIVISGTAATTAHGSRIREFWERYFQAAGANLPPDNYRDFIAGAQQIHC